MSLSGEKDAFTRAGFASRLPGDARTVSTLMQLLGSLPRSSSWPRLFTESDAVLVSERRGRRDSRSGASPP